MIGKVQIVFGIIFLLISVITPFVAWNSYEENVDSAIDNIKRDIIRIGENPSESEMLSHAYLQQVQWSNVRLTATLAGIPGASAVIVAVISIFGILAGLANLSRKGFE